MSAILVPSLVTSQSLSFMDPHHALTFDSTMDNGFLLLNHVKIPHVNMLAKFSGVDPKTNKYIRPASASLVYGTLTWVRSTIVLQSGGVLARGVTIATRYCAVRRQFQDRDAKEWETGENQVLNYTMYVAALGVTKNPFWHHTRSW